MSNFINKHGPLLSISLADAVLIILSVISGILTARFLGPEGRGEFAIVTLWPTLLAALGNLGVKEALTYQQAGGAVPKAQLCATALALAAGQSLALMVLGLAAIPLLTVAHPGEITRMGLVYLAIIPLNLLAIYSLSLLQGSLDIFLYNAIRVSVNLVYVTGLLVLWRAGMVSVSSFAYSLLLANAVTAALAVGAVVWKYGLRWKLDAGLVKEIFRYGLQNHLGSVAGMLNQRADQMLMAVLLTPEQLGLYTVAVNTSGLARLPSGAFSTMLFPKMANASEEERAGVFCTYSRYNLTSTAALGLVLAVAMPLLIPLVYGKGYAGSIGPAEILLLGTVFTGIGQAWAAGLRGIGRPMIATWAEGYALIVTLVGLAVLLPLLGIYGAAITSLAAYAASALYLFRQVKKVWKLNLEGLLRPVSLPVIYRKFVYPDE